MAGALSEAAVQAAVAKLTDADAGEGRGGPRGELGAGARSLGAPQAAQ